MSTPNSQIWVCSNVRLDNRYEHTIYFASNDAQREYFYSRVAKTFSKYTFVRKSWSLQVEATMEEARKWSYLYYRNGQGKYFYCFINNIEYKNDATVELFLELDVIQTYLFGFDNVKLLDCFVERQHTTTDAIGEHTVAEGLETGPYWTYHIYNLEDISTMGVLAMSSVNLQALDEDDTTDTIPKAYGRNFNGVYSGLGVYAFDDIMNLESKMYLLDKLGMSDALVSIWMYPKKLVTLCAVYRNDLEQEHLHTWESFDWSIHKCATVYQMESEEVTLAKYDNYQDLLFEGYAQDVKNNKLFTHPYNMLYVTTNQGDNAEYKFEHFNPTADKYGFYLYGAISPDAGVKLAPTAYNILGSNVNYEEGVTLGNYPSCAWDSDTYKVWLAQNYNQLKQGTTSGAISAGLGVALAAAGAIATVATGGLGALGVAGAVGAIGGGIGSLAGGYNQITSIMAQKEDAKAQPPQAKGAHSATVNVASGKQTFSFYYKCIRKEYAQQVDDYFTMYGYRLNRVQKPNINARPAFTYVKTVGCKITGNLCTEDIVKIENIFDKGITFWKDGNKIGDYSQDNKPT